MKQDMQSQFGTGNVTKLIFKMALPAVAAQIINVLYNIIDRIYIARIPGEGGMALTGLGVAMPIIMIISAFSAFVGQGGAPLASIKMGENDHKGAEKILGSGTSLLIFMSIALTILFALFSSPMLMAFGASAETLPYAKEYLNIYLIGTIFVQLSLGLNTFISAQGHATTAMLSVLIGAVLNTVLDPILIFTFEMGVKGAALATIISQGVSAIWILYFLTRSKKSTLKIRLCNMKPDFHIIGKIALLGISPFVMQATESLVQITLNSGLQKYGGDVYVGSLTIIMSVMQLFVMPVNGVTQGATPILSYNYGALKMDRVKKGFKVLLCSCVAISTFACAMSVFFPSLFVSMFVNQQQDQLLFETTCKGLPIFMSGIWIFGVQMACQATFLSLGQAKVSIFLAFLRKIFLLIPLAIVLPMRFGVMGIYFAEPIADTLSATTALIIFLFVFKKILNKKLNENGHKIEAETSKV